MTEPQPHHSSLIGQVEELPMLDRLTPEMRQLVAGYMKECSQSPVTLEVHRIFFTVQFDILSRTSLTYLPRYIKLMSQTQEEDYHTYQLNSCLI